MNEKYPLIIAIVLLVAATWRQYSSRGTNGSRAIVALAVLLPALPFPTPVALALAGVRNNPATDAISLVPAAEHVEEKERSDLQRNNLHCAPVPVSIPGMQPGWRLSVLSQKDTFESPAGKTASMGWWSSSPDGGRVSDISVCLTSQGLRELGIVVPLTVHTSIALAVYAADPPVLATITLQPFSVPGVGICQFQQYFGSRYYVLSCKAPVSVPKPGRVTLVSDDTWNWPISNIHYVWAPMNLISDLSPVDKWVAMAADRQIREGLADRGQLEFQPETRIAVLRREITVKEVLLDPNN